MHDVACMQKLQPTSDVQRNPLAQALLAFVAIAPASQPYKSCEYTSAEQILSAQA
jgi:hypothetical protein